MSIELDYSQIRAIDNLKTGSILCGGVGSGKSRTALAYYYLKVVDGKLRINGDGVTKKPKKNIPLYVITVAHKRDTHDWENEAIPFYKINMVVDSWNNILKYKNVTNSFFIFDEQRVSGKGIWSKTFIHIAKHNDWIVLSGTPGDVWMDYVSIFIANGFYKNRTDFERQHVVYSRYTKYPKVSRYINEDKLERYKRRILVSMNVRRYTKPHHIYVTTDYNTELYNLAEKQRFSCYKNRPIRNASELCLLLRKIVNSDHSRIKALRRLCVKHDRMIVFYNFRYELDAILSFIETDELFKDKDFSYGQRNGRVHDEVPSTKKWLYIVQYAAGAEAWNCISTDTIVFYSQNYSYKTMEQSCGRINRRNTPYIDLYYYHFISSSSIDRSIQSALKRKKKFNEKNFVDRLDNK